jgi:spore maturation protein CgeB
MTNDRFAANHEALAARSPDVARLVARPAGDGPFRPASAANGEPIVEFHGRPLESRRAPADAARRQAESVVGGTLVLVGFGCGYLAEALLDAGRHVAAIVESDSAALAAALAARDLTKVLASVPVILTSQLGDDADLVLLKSKAPTLATLGARVATDQRLARIVSAWPGLGPVGRRPRVLVVGPLPTGSPAAERSTTRALSAIGADTQLADFAAFEAGWSALGSLALPAEHRGRLQAALADVLGQTAECQAAVFQPDLVLALAGAPLGRGLLDRLRGAGIRTACWLTENWRVLPSWSEAAAGFDTFFAIQGASFLEQVRAAGARKAVYLPLACDPGCCSPRELAPAEQERYGATVSFVGTPSLNRQRVLAALSDGDLRLWGDGWEQTELAHLARGTALDLPPEDLVRVFAGSSINLNIHPAAHVDGLDPDPDFLNARTFELAACGAFQLVDARLPLRDAFRDDEVVSFRSIPELRGQVAHFLAHPQERRACAARALVRALAEHTFAHRARTILSETLPPEMVAAALMPRATRRLSDAVADLEKTDASMGTDEALLRVLLQLEGRP